MIDEIITLKKMAKWLRDILSLKFYHFLRLKTGNQNEIPLSTYPFIFESSFLSRN